MMALRSFTLLCFVLRYTQQLLLLLSLSFRMDSATAPRAKVVGFIFTLFYSAAFMLSSHHLCLNIATMSDRP